MMKTTGLLRRLYKVPESIRCGEGIRDRLRLFLVFLLLVPFLSRNVRESDSRKMLIYRSILNYLCVGLRVKVRGVWYVMNDYENLVVLPFYAYWMWDYLKPQKGDVFLDVGAHVGKYTLQVAKIVGEKGLVVAIEPDPANYAVLKRNMEMNNARNVIAINVAAWHCDTKLKIYLFESSLGNSVKSDFGLGSKEIEARALDGVLQEIGVNRVDWIKINVEGAELETLRGLENTLRNFYPKVIAEIWHDYVGEVTTFISKIGYSMRTIPTAHDKDFSYYLLLPE